MPRRATPLAAAKVKTAKLGRYYDGDGLMLFVKPSADKRGDQPPVAFWVFRYTLCGCTRETGLGRARDPNAVSLATACAKVRTMREVLAAGRDPINERDSVLRKKKKDDAKAKVRAMTVSMVAKQDLADNEPSWRNPKHRQQWRNTLRGYVLPRIGDLPVSDVATAAVKKMVQPLWLSKTETASRVRARIEAILDYANVSGWREGENPARWRGHLDQLLPAPGKVRQVEHHPARPRREIGAFMAKLRDQTAIAAKALECAILTGVRSVEARGVIGVTSLSVTPSGPSPRRA